MCSRVTNPHYTYIVPKKAVILQKNQKILDDK